jgi:hypothetical protein
MGVASTPCVLGELDEELDDELEELDELEPVGCCACIAGTSTSPPTSNTAVVDAISPCR